MNFCRSNFGFTVVVVVSDDDGVGFSRVGESCVVFPDDTFRRDNPLLMDDDDIFLVDERRIEQNLENWDEL